MRTFQSAIFLGTLIISSAIGSTVFGQSVVQLPEFGVVGAGSTILVPDGGSAHLGSISRLSEGAVSRGVPFASNVPGLNRLFKNRGIGRNTQTGTMRVHVRIINLEEMDKELLAEGIRFREAEARAVARERGHVPLNPDVKKKADFINRNIGRFNQSNQRKRKR